MLIPETLPSLVSINRFKDVLKISSSFSKSFRLIEANVGANTREQYNNGHIENAIFMDTMHCTEPTKYFPRNLPNRECFRDYVGSLGISNKHHLILYDRSPFGFYASSRMWWIFRLVGHENVSILNGGLNAWVRDNNQLSIKTPNYEKEKFVLKENPKLIRNFQQIQKIVEKKNEDIIDARGPGDFSRINEFNDRENHIPSSKNVPYASLFDTNTGLIKEKTELAELFKQNGVDLNDVNKPLVTSCLTGMTACSLAYALYLLGFKNVPVYYGSWTEYSQKLMDDEE